MRWYRRSRKYHSRQRPRERSSLPLVRRSQVLYPSLLDRPLVASRGIRISSVQRGGLILRHFKQNRFPLVGIRLQREWNATGDQIFRNMIDVPYQVPAVKSVCHTRSLRRRVLFASRVAGPHMRRSPGRGGTYNRTVDSETTCKRI